MNSENYCSLNLAQRLIDAGIVLETDHQWLMLKNEDCYLSGEIVPMIEIIRELPAPSMAELWRELPEYITNGSTIQYLEMGKTGSKTYASYDFADDYVLFDNPADALAELLIWVKEQKVNKDPVIDEDSAAYMDN